MFAQESSTARAAASAQEPVAALGAAFVSFLDLACEPEVRQIVLIDAHSVVGWQKWRECEERHGFGRMKEGLQVLVDMGRLREEMVDVYAHILLAALIEVAFMISRAPDPEAAREAGCNAMKVLLDRLLGS